MTAIDHLLYALLWLSFGLGHSLLAGQFGRRALAPLVGRWHRLAYNLIALAHLIVIWAVGRFVLDVDGRDFDLPVIVHIAQWSALAAALVLFWQGGRRYELGRFIGTRPEGPGALPEPLVTDGVHAYLRHPLYAAGYLALFGLVSDAFSLATAIWASLYLALGTLIEERRLDALYGEGHRAYRREVPALVPRFSRRARPSTARHDLPRRR